MISSLPWDTDFFGISVGKICIDAQSDPFAVKEELQSAAFDVVYVFMEQPTEERLRQVQSVAALYDIKLTYKKELKPVKQGAEIQCVVPYQGVLSDELLSLAYMSGIYSRFYLDPKFKPHFHRLYEAWMKRSLDGTLADQVFVYMDQSRVLGFITVSEKNNASGQIGLLAVHPECRGKGVAKALMATAESWFFSRGIHEVIVVTQESNVPACRFYEKSSYQVNARIAICHGWK